MLKYFPVKPTCTTIKNPQANAILEIIHQAVSSMLKTKDIYNITFDEVSLWGEIIASIVYAVLRSYHITLQGTSVQLLFGRDMVLDIDFQPNYKEMWIRKKRIINYNNKRKVKSECNTTMLLATTRIF